MENLISILPSLSVHELYTVVRVARSYLPSLNCLNNDCLKIILLFLCPLDRLSLIAAVCGLHKSGFPPVCSKKLLFKYEMIHTFLIENACLNVHSAIDHVVQNNILRGQNCLLLADWSPFSHRFPQVFARTTISKMNIQRLVTRYDAIRNYVEYSINRHCGRIRFVFHACTGAHHPPDSHQILSHGTLLNITVSPLHVFEVDLVAPTWWTCQADRLLHSIPFRDKKRFPKHRSKIASFASSLWCC